MTITRRLLLALLVLASAAACGGEDGPAAASPAPAPTPASASPTAASLPSAVPASVTVEEIGSLGATKVEVRFGDWLAAGAGSVWVKTDDGRVVRIDPGTAAVAETVEVTADKSQDALCQGLGASDAAVWACAPDGKIVRIDPATGEVAATVDAGKFHDQGQIPVAFGAAWVLVGDGSRLAAVRADAVDKVYDLGTRCTELSATADSVWAACPVDGQAVRVDPDSGTVTARVTGLTGARTIGASPGGDVWVGFSGGLARIEESTGRVTAVADAAPGLEGGVYASNRGAWTRARGDFLRRVDVGTAEVTRRISAPEQSGGAVLEAYGYLWATAYDDDVLYRLPAGEASAPASPSPSATQALGFRWDVENPA